MISSDEVRVILHEECEDQHTDMHSIIIGIGCDNDVVVSQILEVLFHAKCGDKKVKLFILSYFPVTFLVTVDRLSPE